MKADSTKFLVMKTLNVLVVGAVLTCPPCFLSELLAGEAVPPTGKEGQPVKLYPRPAVNTYISERWSEVKYVVPTDDSLGWSWTEKEFDDSGWETGKNGLGYENGTRSVVTLANEIKTDVRDAMFGISPSLYARYTFEIDNASYNLHGLKLRVKFDDGYEAYLNSELIASRNAPAKLTWDSNATTTHTDTAAVQWDEEVIEVPGELVKGKNVLAIHAFNSSVSGSDFLLSAELDVNETVYTEEPFVRGDMPFSIPLEEAESIFHDFDRSRADFDLSFRSRHVRIGTKFINYESPHAHPIDLSPSGEILAVVNTPAARVEMFNARTEPLEPIASIPVGIDPVSVRFRSDEEFWVVNHISDNVSIVNVREKRLVRTVPTGDEPADVIFASSNAYVTCSQENTVEVFDLKALDKPSTRITIEGEDPRSLALSPDGKTIYAAVFESGNSSTILAGGIENKEMMQYPPNVVSSPESPYGGQNPPPLRKDTSIEPLPDTIQQAPEVSLIVKKDENGVWRDGNGTDWTRFVSGKSAPLSGRPVGWDVIDNDIAMIDVATGNVTYATGLMNIAMAMDVHPVTGEVLLVGTEANNEVRFEPELQSHFIQVTGAIVRSDGEKKIFDLNPHLDKSIRTLPREQRSESIGDPRAVQYDSTGSRAYVAGMGSNNLAVLDSTGARVGTIRVGEGPTGLALDAEGNRLFVMNRFDASISVVDLNDQTETSRVKFFDPTPYAIKRGRRVFYNTHLASGLGQVSCASCHLDGRMDRLAWDLGDPTSAATSEKRFMVTSDQKTMTASPMKGPMVTQTLQDIDEKGPFHWRGDRLTIEDFNITFVDLLGNDRQMSDLEMEDFKTFLGSMHFPPNPYREPDNSLSRDLPLPGRYTTGAFGEAGKPLPEGNARRGFLTIFSGRKNGYIRYSQRAVTT
jgi:DNA-binding beta-propeller fold protein YncE